MDENYIFVEMADNTGVFIKEDTIISVQYDQAKKTAIIATSDGESYPVVGFLAVHELHDYFYQRSQLKLFREKQ